MPFCAHDQSSMAAVGGFAFMLPPMKLKPEKGSKQRAAGLLKARTKKRTSTQSSRLFVFRIG